MAQRTSFRTGDQSLVREINLSLIMSRLHRFAPVSRAALAEMTGLNKSTVSSLVNELIELRFVRELGVLSNGIGRPSVQLELNPGAGFIVSAEIGVGFISVLCADFTASVLWRNKENSPADMGHEMILARTLEMVREAVEHGARLTGDAALLGIAVGIPGLVDQGDGTLLFAPNLHWRDVPVRAMFQAAFGAVPIFVDNEANMAALGEYFFGAARGYDQVLYLSAGVGLGGAVVQSGRLLRGIAGFAGEFGHMTMYPGGEMCNCGNRGCWETRVSQSALFRHVREAISGGQSSVLGAQTDRLTMQAVYKAAKTGDGVALAAIEQVGHDLGIGIASLVNVLNPDLVLFGGIISLASEFLMPVIEAEISQRALGLSAKVADVAPAKHGSDACVMGGVAVVYQAILAQPASLGRRLAV